MKKVLIILTAILISCSFLSGCGWLKNWKEKYILDTNNGVILYGNEQQIQTSINKHKNKLIFSEIYKIKMVMIDNYKIMVLDKNTAASLRDKGLFKDVKNGNVEAATPELDVNKQQGILYGKKELNELVINGQHISFKYDGNKVIGNSRSYANMFLIVDHSVWDTVKGTEKAMGVLEFKEKPYKSQDQYDAEKGQLVKIR
ncbi:lipoprotein BA_5634 family protein [Heyndrickxia sp. NPDC080065]|uniref:lipoprotein BA_5634 family protein n=1 Tax=Heyndrickxia sp. NPDC080065 TaxID=3390568 RepID=UPI003CFCF166